jgi:hypothetical protein
MPWAMRLRALVVLAAAATVLAAPASAAANYEDVLRDCSDDGRFTGSYTRAELTEALRRMPAVLREYTDCASLITAALAPGGSGICGSRTTGRRELLIRLRPPKSDRIVSVEAYLDGRRVLRKTGHRVTCVILRRPRRARCFTVTLVVTTASGRWSSVRARRYGAHSPACWRSTANGSAEAP